jgi:hypothetical protein
MILLRVLHFDFTGLTFDTFSNGIDGNEFEGTRFVETVSDGSGLTNTTELWRSSELKRVGLATVSGPYATHIARVKNLRRRA